MKTGIAWILIFFCLLTFGENAEVCPGSQNLAPLSSTTVESSPEAPWDKRNDTGLSTLEEGGRIWFAKTWFSPSLEPKVERIVFKLFAGNTHFPVPELYDDASPEKERRVVTRKVNGLTLQNLLSALEQILSENKDSALSEKIKALKTRLLHKATLELQYWQGKSPEILKALSDEGITVAPYPYAQRLEQTCASFFKILAPESETAKEGIAKEIEHLARFLTENAQVAFRDSAPWNLVIELPEFEGLNPAQTQDLLLKKIQDETLSDLDFAFSKWMNVDFSLAHSQTTFSDDWIHLLSAFSPGTTVDQLTEWVGPPEYSQEQILEMAYTVVGRNLRLWGRSLFFLNDRTNLSSDQYEEYRRMADDQFSQILGGIQKIRELTGDPQWMKSLEPYLNALNQRVRESAAHREIRNCAGVLLGTVRSDTQAELVLRSKNLGIEEGALKPGKASFNPHELDVMQSLLTTPSRDRGEIQLRQGLMKTLMTQGNIENFLELRGALYGYLHLLETLQKPDEEDRNDETPWLAKLLEDPVFQARKAEYFQAQGSFAQRRQKIGLKLEKKSPASRSAFLLEQMDQHRKRALEFVNTLEQSGDPLLASLGGEFASSMQAMGSPSAHDLLALFSNQDSAGLNRINTIRDQLWGRTVRFGGILACASMAKYQNLKPANFDESKGAHYKNAWNLARKKEGQVKNPSDPEGRDPAFSLLTGSNMSGKSYDLQRRLYMQLCAQSMGWVPADADNNFHLYARIAYVDRADTDSARHLSAHTAEMDHLKAALGNLPGNTLFLGDEIGSATSPEEAYYLLHGLKAYGKLRSVQMVLASHNEYFIRSVEGEEGVGLYHLKVKIKDPSEREDKRDVVERFHVLESGVDESHSILMARQLGLEPGVLETAESYLDRGQLSPDPVSPPVFQDIRAYDEAQRENMKRRAVSFEPFFPGQNSVVLSEKPKERDEYRHSYQNRLLWAYPQNERDLQPDRDGYSPKPPQCVSKNIPDLTPLFKILSSDGDFQTGHDAGLLRSDMARWIGSRSLHRINKILLTGGVSNPRELLERQKLFSLLREPSAREGLSEALYAVWDYLSFIAYDRKTLFDAKENLNLQLLESSFREISGSGGRGRYNVWGDEQNADRRFLAQRDLYLTVIRLNLALHPECVALSKLMDLLETLDRQRKEIQNILKQSREEELNHPQSYEERKQSLAEENRRAAQIHRQLAELGVEISGSESANSVARQIPGIEWTRQDLDFRILLEGMDLKAEECLQGIQKLAQKEFSAKSIGNPLNWESYRRFLPDLEKANAEIGPAILGRSHRDSLVKGLVWLGNSNDLADQLNQKMKSLDSVCLHQWANYLTPLLKYCFGNLQKGSDLRDIFQKLHHLEEEKEESSHHAETLDLESLAGKYGGMLEQSQRELEQERADLNKQLQETQSRQYRDEHQIQRLSERIAGKEESLRQLSVLEIWLQNPGTPDPEKESELRLAFQILLKESILPAQSWDIHKLENECDVPSTEYEVLMLQSEMKKLEAILNIGELIQKLDFAKAEFNNTGEMKIQGGYSLTPGPPQDRQDARNLKERQVPNDIEMDSTRRMSILTGPNGSGKTHLEKVLAWNLLSVQSTGFGPAVSINTPVFTGGVYLDRIGELQFNNLSSFGQDVLFWNQFFSVKAKNPRQPFVVLGITDEVWSTASPREGTGLLLGVMKQILKRGGYLLTAGHNHQAFKAFADAYPAYTRMFHLGTEFNEDAEGEGVKYSYRLRSGQALSHGVAIAEARGLRMITDLIDPTALKQRLPAHLQPVFSANIREAA